MADSAIPAWAAEPAPGKLFKLLVSKDGTHVDDIVLNKSSTTFGRNSAMCDVALDHASLSRRHALIAYNAYGVPCLLDLNSTHGTFLNGEKVPPQPLTLELGDVLTFGASTRKYTLASGASASSQSQASAHSVAAAAHAEESDDDDDIGPMPPPPVPAARSVGPSVGPASVGSMPPPPLPAHARPKGTVGPTLPQSLKTGPVTSVAGASQSGSTASSSSGRPVGPSAGPDDHAGTGPQSSVAQDRSGLQAAIESMKAPLVYKPSEGASSAGASSSSHAGAGAGDDMSALLPTSFGSRKAGQQAAKRGRDDDDDDDEDEAGGSASGPAAVEDSDSDDDFGPAPPPSLAAKASGAVAPGELAKALGLPVSHEAILTGHAKSITCLGFDNGGGRLVTGSSDYSVRLYDFGGMDRSHRSFRDTVPQDGQPLRCVAWSTTGDRFAAATASSQLKVFDREGRVLVTTIKGDMYLSDAVNTKGHQAAACWVGWHPAQGRKDTLLSASADGTIRLWDLAAGKRIFEELCCSDVIKFKSARGTKLAVTTAAIEPSGKFVLAGLEDGSIHMVMLKSPGFRYTRSDATIRAAHAGTVTALVFSPDGLRFASRGMDDVVRVWDCSKGLTDRSTPTASVTGVPCTVDSANVCWSPDSKLLCAGTAVASGRAAAQAEAEGKTAEVGRVVVFDVAALEATGPNNAGSGAGAGAGASSSASSQVLQAGTGVPCSTAAVFSVAIGPKLSAIALAWHAKINQIAVGCSDGQTRLLYSPVLSSKGALLSTARAPKARDSDSDYVAVGVGNIYLPNALPMFRDDTGPMARPDKKRRMEESIRTELPAPGGSGPAKPVDLNAPVPGAVPEYLTHAKRTFTEYFMQHAISDGPGAERNLRAEDPQAVLTRYAGKGAASLDTALFTRAYATTQPKAILAAKTLEEERDEATRLADARAKAKAAQGGGHS